MAIVWGTSSQKFAAAIGAVIVSHFLQCYDDGGAVLNAAEITNRHASLASGGSFSGGSRLRISIVDGKVQMEVDTNGLPAGTYWYQARSSTNGGSSWSSDPGGEIHVYTADVETINIGAGATYTMTANLPSAGKTKLVVNFGSSTSVLDGTASGFRIVSTDGTCKGGVELNGPGKCYRMGSATAHVVELSSVCDGPALIDQVTFDACGPILKYNGSGALDGYFEVTGNTVETNSLATSESNVATTVNQIEQGTGTGNREYPSLIQGNRIGKAPFSLRTCVTVTKNILQGYRCGAGWLGGGRLRKWTKNYVDTKHDHPWTQVSGVGMADDWTVANGDEFSGNVCRGAQWQLRPFGGDAFWDCVMADIWSHNYIDPSQGSVDLIIRNFIFLPTTQTVPQNNNCGIDIRANNIRFEHCTYKGGTYPVSPIAHVRSDKVFKSFKSNLITGLRLDGGDGVPVAAIAPSDSGGLAQAMSGSPLRATAGTPNRITDANYNGWHDNSGDNSPAQTYENYGVGTITGSPGANDVSGDPLYVTGSYTFANDATIWAMDPLTAADTIRAAVWAAFTLGASSPMRGVAHDGTHIGAVQDDAPASGGGPLVGGSLVGRGKLLRRLVA